jgi:hypothetical protein
MAEGCRSQGFLVSETLNFSWDYISLGRVSADDGNIAFQAAINITGITVTDPFANTAALAAPSERIWTFSVPVTINRYASSAQGLFLTIYVMPVMLIAA